MNLLKKFDSRTLNVSFIGSGNLAWHLAPALDNTDYAVREVYSLNEKNAAALVDKLYQAQVKKSLDFSGSPSRIFIIAVTDDSIADVAQQIILPDNAILVHTSGSQPLSVLGYGMNNIGVFYPLQTFSKSKKVDFQEVPFLIESEDTSVQKILMTMAKALSKKVFATTYDDRKAIHVAAVFASNFTNHMISIAEDILVGKNLKLDLLKPLIAETLNKSLAIGPAKAQTGPAQRGDLEILDKHLQFLQHDEQLSEIYRVVSQHILDQYN